MRTIVLLGARGAGKSSVARELARALGREALDLDAAIVARAGKSIAAIFSEDGEERFRTLESDALRDALARPGTLLAPGGGVVLRDENRELLHASGALLVYLRARPETLADRVRADRSSVENRPALVAGGPLEEARRLLRIREPHYLALAQLVLDTDALSVAAVAARIIEHGV